MVDLLHTIHPDVIEALIDGTLGYKFATDDTFRSKCYKEDSLAGVYAVSVVSYSGRGMSRREWESVKEMMIRYNEGLHRDLTTSGSREEYDCAFEAARIERAYRRSEQDLIVIARDTKAGERLFFVKSEVLNAFIRNLDMRMSEELDPSGHHRQLQAPIYVGCSTNIHKRVNAHDPMANNLTGSAALPTLLHSCLKVLDIQTRHVCVPILKIWDKDTLDIAEVLVTYLAGSMVKDGGLNVQFPGQRAIDEEEGKKLKQKLEEGEKQCFVDNQWAMDNLERTEAGLQRRKKVRDLFAQDNDKLEEEITAAEDELRLVVKALEEEETERARLQTLLQEKNKEIADMRFKDWIGKQEEQTRAMTSQLDEYSSFGGNILSRLRNGKWPSQQNLTTDQ